MNNRYLIARIICLSDSMAEACYQELHGARYIIDYIHMKKYIPRYLLIIIHCNMKRPGLDPWIPVRTWNYRHTTVHSSSLLPCCINCKLKFILNATATGYLNDWHPFLLKNKFYKLTKCTWFKNTYASEIPWLHIYRMSAFFYKKRMWNGNIIRRNLGFLFIVIFVLKLGIT